MARRFTFPLLIAMIAVLVLDWPASVYAAGRHRTDEQVCDPVADYFLGMGDYREAVRRHQMVIQAHPADALAHYHLGFAYGLMGQRDLELKEYRKAVDLGLDDWQLFLNLGLAELRRGDLRTSTEILKLAALLGPFRPETHFNLGLAYERRAMFAEAEQEMLLSLQLDPRQADARNTLGVIYAEQGRYLRAHKEWAELLSAEPSYSPARSNLAILEKIEDGNLKSTRSAAGFIHAP